MRRYLHADPLKRMRAKGWERFQQLGLPSRRHEQFRYLKMRHLYSQSLSQTPVVTFHRWSRTFWLTVIL